MAIVYRYVRADAAGGGDGTNDTTQAWTLTEAFTNGAGYYVYVKAGTYTRTADDTVTIDGTAATPTVFCGYNVTPGDLDAQGRTLEGTGPLDTTNFPVIAYNATYRLNAFGANYTIWQNLKITANANLVALLGSATGGACVRCYAENANTGSSASGLKGQVVLECDANLTGGSGTGAGIIVDPNGYAESCRVIAAPNTGFRLDGAAVLFDCTVVDCGGAAFLVNYTTTTTPLPILIHCTVYSCGGNAVSVPDAAFTLPLIISGCHITDGAAYAVNNLGSASRNLMVIAARNRTRDNTSGVFNGFADWAAATSFGHVTTAGSAAADYQNPTGSPPDFRLKATAPGHEAAYQGRDIGAGTYQMKASDLGLLAADLQSGVTVDDVTGTFAAPAVGDVQTGVGYGAGGTEFTGTLALPTEAQVESGVGFGAGGTEFEGTLTGGVIIVEDD